MRSAGVLVIAAVVLSACAGELTSETAAASHSRSPISTPSLAPSPSPTPSLPPSSRGPAISGLRVDDVLAGWQDFGLTCEDGLAPAGHPLLPGLVGAQCLRQNLHVLINHWPDGGVLSMDVLSYTHDPSAEISSSDRNALLRHVATTEYEGSDPDVAAGWLLANHADECGPGCHLTIGDAEWFYAVGVRNADQISMAPADR